MSLQMMETTQNKGHFKCPFVKIELPEKMMPSDIFWLTDSVIDYYVKMNDDHRFLCALWTIGTYWHRNLNTYPLLLITGQKGSAKSRLARLISTLGHGGLGHLQNNISEASLFRHTQHCILALDEIEQINSKERQTLRELLNSCYKKGAIVSRQARVKKDGVESFETRMFSPFFPLILSNINGFGDVLTDRSISIILEKISDDVRMLRQEDYTSSLALQALKRQYKGISDDDDESDVIFRLMTNWNDFIDAAYSLTSSSSSFIPSSSSSPSSFADKERQRLEPFFVKLINSKIEGRNLELFMPLLYVAYKLNDDYILSEALRISKAFVQFKIEEDLFYSVDNLVFKYVASLQPNNYHSMKDKLLWEFKMFSGHDEAWVTDKWLGHALNRTGLILHKKHTSRGAEYILNIEKAKERVQKMEAKTNG